MLLYGHETIIIGTVLACGSGSGKISLVEQIKGQVSHLEVPGSTEALCYSHKADALYSVGSTGNIAVWQ